MKRLFRFFKALYRYIVHGHFENVGFDEYVRRLDICRDCGLYDGRTYVCNKCGCYLDKKCKWKTEHCHDGKW